jgi:hypothetical protein
MRDGTHCAGPRCKTPIRGKRTFCYWHWEKLPIEMRDEIQRVIATKNLHLIGTTTDIAIKYLQGKQREKDEQRRQEKEAAARSAADNEAGAGV